MHQEDERDLDEDDILDDKEVVMNHRPRNASKGNLHDTVKPDVDGTFAKFKTTEDMRKEIEKMSKKLEAEN